MKPYDGILNISVWILESTWYNGGQFYSSCDFQAEHSLTHHAALTPLKQTVHLFFVY